MKDEEMKNVKVIGLGEMKWDVEKKCNRFSDKNQDFSGCVFKKKRKLCIEIFSNFSNIYQIVVVIISLNEALLNIYLEHPTLVSMEHSNSCQRMQIVWISNMFPFSAKMC